MQNLVVIRGAGDLATGVAQRLFRAGFALVLLEQKEPRMVRQGASLAKAVYEGYAKVEDISALLVREDLPGDGKAAREVLRGYLQRGCLPIVVDPGISAIELLQPTAVVDAIMAKRPTGTHLGLAPIVVALGPGFRAGLDVHAVVETQRGHHLGRVLTEGEAAPNTGVPGALGGLTWERVLRAPVNGWWRPLKNIGDLVSTDELVGVVDAHGAQVSVTSSAAGRLRGVLWAGLSVVPGEKLADIDPVASYEDCFTISDKARAIGGGVLEALLWLGRAKLWGTSL